MARYTRIYESNEENDFKQRIIKILSAAVIKGHVSENDDVEVINVLVKLHILSQYNYHYTVYDEDTKELLIAFLIIVSLIANRLKLKKRNDKNSQWLEYIDGILLNVSSHQNIDNLINVIKMTEKSNPYIRNIIKETVQTGYSLIKQDANKWGIEQALK